MSSIVLPAAHYNILCSCTEHCVTVVTYLTLILLYCSAVVVCGRCLYGTRRYLASLHCVQYLMSVSLFGWTMWCNQPILWPRSCSRKGQINLLPSTLLLLSSFTCENMLDAGNLYPPSHTIGSLCWQHCYCRDTIPTRYHQLLLTVCTVIFSGVLFAARPRRV